MLPRSDREPMHIPSDMSRDNPCKQPGSRRAFERRDPRHTTKVHGIRYWRANRNLRSPLRARSQHRAKASTTLSKACWRGSSTTTSPGLSPRHWARCFDVQIEAGTDREVPVGRRSEEHTSELQSLMRISYAVFCLK